ncbi:unnamed protein product, partial [Amoebophrya sp. A120]|eukprot:GSA120T00000933001.1
MDQSQKDFERLLAELSSAATAGLFGTTKIAAAAEVFAQEVVNHALRAGADCPAPSIHAHCNMFR